jgi:phenylacetate-CoA ligase
MQRGSKALQSSRNQSLSSDRRFVSRLISRYLLYGFERFIKGRSTFAYLTGLQKTQWSSPDELSAMQTAALRRLLAHATAHCPYYRDRWRPRGLDPESIQSPADLEKWPRTDRADVRQFRTQMRADIPGLKLIAKSTGGSTGEPVQFDLDNDSNDRRSAAALRGYGWAGIHPGDRQLHLWGVPIVKQSRARRWKESLYHALYRRKMLSTFGLSESRFDEYLTAYNSCRPDSIVAYTSSLYEFARMIHRRGLTPFRPKSIVVGAEKLHPFQRELIEAVFHAPVFETYGSREVMLIGAECDRHRGLHLTAEHLIAEVLDDDGRPVAAGVEGDIHVTDLYNYGMPFVRYKTGDRAVGGLTQCPCGRGLPLLSGVAGRSMDTLTTPDGRRVSGALFPHLMKDFASVVRFQVVQDRLDHVQLRVVAGPGFSDVERDKIRELIGEELGPAVNFELLTVDDIPLTGAGKLRVVVNQCADPRPGVA